MTYKYGVKLEHYFIRHWLLSVLVKSIYRLIKVDKDAIGTRLNLIVTLIIKRFP